MGRISLIIPNLNSGKYSGLCVESIKRSKLEFHEIIIVDGRSSDGSCETLYNGIKALSYSPKLVVRDPRGIYDAWNIGINEACGDYLYILPSDDVLHIGIEKLAAVAKKSECDIVFGNGIDLDGNELYPGLCKRDVQKCFFGSGAGADEYIYIDNKKFIRATLSGGSCIVSQTQVLIRRETASAIPFRTEVGSTADYFAQIDWILSGSRAIFVNSIVGAWRRHDNSASKKELGSSIYAYKINLLATIYRRFNIREGYCLDLLQVYSGLFRGERPKGWRKAVFGVFTCDIVALIRSAWYARGGFTGARKILVQMMGRET